MIKIFSINKKKIEILKNEIEYLHKYIDVLISKNNRKIEPEPNYSCKYCNVGFYRTYWTIACPFCKKEIYKENEKMNDKIDICINCKNVIKEENGCFDVEKYRCKEIYKINPITGEKEYKKCYKIRKSPIKKIINNQECVIGYEYINKCELYVSKLKEDK